MASTPLPFATPSFGETGLGLLRLVRIEVRRSLGFVLFPVLVGIAWLATHQLAFYDETPRVALWPADSLKIGAASLLLAPFVAAIVTWDAGRESRRRMNDLLATTPNPPFTRDLTRWAGTSAWGVLAYLMVAAISLIETARAATWGGPMVGPLVLGLLVIPAAGAVGYLAGALWPSRFVPPVVAILVYVVTFGVAALGPRDPFSELKFLSPMAHYFNNADPQAGVFFEVNPNLFGQASFWTLAATFLALCLIALRRDRSQPTQIALSIALLLAVVTAYPLTKPPADAGYWGVAITYEPSCQTEIISVCVHPAYEALLPDISQTIGAIIAPMTGFDGGIMRAEQQAGESGITDDGVLQWPAFVAQDTGELLPGFVADTAVRIGNEQDNCYGLLNNAQFAVATALMARGDWTFQPPTSPGFTCEAASFSRTSGPEMDSDAAAVQADVLAAADRFAALSVEEQRRWFAANLAVLRAGELTLDDLP